MQARRCVYIQFSYSSRDITTAMNLNRRQFFATTGLTAAGLITPSLHGQTAGERPPRAEGVTVLNPRNRVPLSFIIDDSTCLVNLAHFCIPQFAEVFPDRYQQDWRKLPREIPDTFVREFGEWCAERDIKGKYSIVPYPACVGWVDREMPGWTRRELEDSLKLVREVMMPNWDIHPEMVTHTWGINIKTGRPFETRTEQFMENWGFSVGKSTDELTEYLAYALRVLKNAGLPCEGVTTPGGFGNKVLPQLSAATLASVRDVFQAEVPHYFRHLFTDDRSVAPRVENASGLDSNDPRCVVSIIGCTGDWFGGWDGLERGDVDKLITEDGKGRMPEVIARGEPAIMVCHWPGIYFNGERVGFNIFKEAVKRMHARYDNLLWMKLSEIARYWAAKELTRIERTGKAITLRAPFATDNFTLAIPSRGPASPIVTVNNETKKLEPARSDLDLKPGQFFQEAERLLVCFRLAKGTCTVTI
jgi:hypothetical protein